MSTQTHAFSAHESRPNVRKHRSSTIATAAAGGPAGGPGPVLTTTVPREFVHRAAVSEVLLTGWEAAAGPHGAGDCAYVVRAQWPRGHSLFSQSCGYQDPMLLVESVRQAGSLLAHAEFGVPFGHQFLMRDIEIATTPELLLATPKPTELELHTQCRDVVRRGANLSSMRYEVTVRLGGKRLATGSASFTCISPDVYRRLRKGQPTAAAQAAGAPVDPATVGRLRAENVVLTQEPAAAQGPRSWALRIDSSHPIFFDHPVDHIPGMVLLEASRQAAYAATGCPDKLVTGISGTFTRYAELDAPCRIEAVPGESADGVTRVRVNGVQGGNAVLTADVVLSTPAL
ncbi:ScbA/BarX family gamma-butyrolactone biosynthesis protein [Streptomyces cyaneofuscatus]|uniref:ScbA/BarX family gamma-butyrolactone biosynthesis protein n=1 Tax=Streptomyces cyaneofuscatus TaxID=66883 RepID=UPI00382BB9AE